MKDIEMIYLENGIAKYRIRRDHIIDGRTVQITYYIYFGQRREWHLENRQVLKKARDRHERKGSS
ncbi:MAG: hypothetical protein MZV70_59680 [Desulfobacterales bacterium]|nr:hypothetical protein [Desulfobacterales bacterium]